MIALLHSLADRQWHHGYDLMKDTGLLSGTLYPLLIRMSEQDLVEAEWREPAMTGRPARHAYRLTQKGMALVQDLARNDPALSGKAVRI
ncbi:PadR family transcriptional regulator [Stakelama pacifica]|uniref:PadR family transcriptional regulator n=1 Tax=Stakelama pacifica TaxID=517720 RepID=A0A4R6FYK0_9SPHN|nr:PadR family transcriptional regulator [Stakelama pacifica]MAW98939.1 PadR family transcriptional regulator [Sphingomonas sp.]TDN86440.1 PadR family transcriptional regulator [Stakelama pacifica]GGO89649.1 hypothetical protein GCM10011329_00090 [Stakelama pacifica]|tara:strand:+ start:224 stop:490 length:267 start_codon:yes stop_codon:yes gene_type:complete